MSSPTSTTPNATPYELQERDILVSSNARYLVLKFSGEGNFGKVAKCVNLTTENEVAVKIHKENDEDSIQRELEMLEAIRTLDPDKSNIVRFFEGFRIHDLSCLTFEMLDKSLLDLMWQEQRTMRLNEIRPIARQLLVAFDALKSIGIVHLDLKPDNIMFINHQDQPFKLKLIDFGLAQRMSQLQVGNIIQPLSYQAPEVELGLPLSEAMDMWSVGCVMAFMYFGANLLPYYQYDRMRTIVSLLGQPADDLLNAATYASAYFCRKDDSSPVWRLKTSEEFEETTGVQGEIRPMKFGYKTLDNAVQSYPEATSNYVDYIDRLAFISLLKSCLNLDPQTRATPREAMMNPFISMVHLEDMVATSSHAAEALQIMCDSQHLVGSDDSSVEQANIDTDGGEYRSDTDSCISENSLSGYDADWSDCSFTDEDNFVPVYRPVYSYPSGGDSDSPPPTPSLPSSSNGHSYCSDICSTDRWSSADEDNVFQPSSMRCSDSPSFTDEDDFVLVYDYPSGGDSDSLPQDLPSSNNGHSEGEMFNLDMSSVIYSCDSGVSEGSSLSHEECGAAPTSPQIYEVTDSTNDGAADNTTTIDEAADNTSTIDEAADNTSTIDEAADNTSTTDEAADNTSTTDEAADNTPTTDGAAANTTTTGEAAAATQPAVRKKFRSVRKFFSRIRRRVVSFFNN